MKNPIQAIAAFAGQLGIEALFTLFLVGLFVYVMTRNYRRMIREEFRPNLLEGEKLLDRLDVTGLITSTRTIFTDRRVLQLYLGWFFSRRKVFSIAWVDTHSVVFKRSVAWLAFILAAFISGRINPITFLLILWGLDSRAYAIVFETPFALMPWTRVRVASRNRAALPEFARFYQRAHAVWAQMRGEMTPATTVSGPEAIVIQETDFALGKTVWVSILVVMACAFIQRIAEGNVGFDSFAFGPIYLATPVAAARFSRRDGFWVALLGFVGILTVKFPLVGLSGVLANDGGMPYFAQYIGVLVTLLLMSEASSAIARFGRPSLSAFAALLWIPYVALHMPTAASDLGLYARAIAAVGVALLAAVLAPWMARETAVSAQLSGQ